MRTETSGWLTILLLLFAPSVVRAADDDAPDPEKTATVAAITIKGDLAESAGQIGIFGELDPNLSDTLQRLKRAAEDDELSAVVLKIRSPAINFGKLNELRQAIAKVRDAGKRVIAECDSATTFDYLLACACDEIVMPESGVLMLPGLRAEVTYFKALFDKVGVKADMMQVGDFKGAAEPFTRTGMSPAFRKQYEALLDDLFEQIVSTISEARNLSDEQVRELIDAGLHTPDKAKAAGLIDRVAYQDQLETGLEESLGVDKLVMVTDYAKKKVDNDFSGMLGMMKLFELMMGGEPTKRSSSRKKVAVIYASGMIVTGKSEASMFGGSVMGSDTIVKAVRQAADDDSVVAVVLRVDSPGGSSLASDLIWRALQECEKPVIASMGDTAASGGYYISVGCDKIYAEPGTLTGSIGVVGGKIVFKDMLDKVGVSTDVISRGKNSGLLSMEAPFSNSERAAFVEMMQVVYDQFVSKTAAGRKMTRDQVLEVAGGRVWTGRQAQEKGLVDELGTLGDAIAEAKKLGGVESDEQVELLVLPKPTSVLDQLLGIDAAAAGVDQQLGHGLERLSPEMSETVRRVASLRRVFSEPAVCILPCFVTIR